MGNPSRFSEKVDEVSKLVFPENFARSHTKNIEDNLFERFRKLLSQHPCLSALIDAWNLEGFNFTMAAVELF